MFTDNHPYIPMKHRMQYFHETRFSFNVVSDTVREHLVNIKKSVPASIYDHVIEVPSIKATTHIMSD